MSHKLIGWNILATNPVTVELIRCLFDKPFPSSGLSDRPLALALIKCGFIDRPDDNSFGRLNYYETAILDGRPFTCKFVPECVFSL